MQLRMTLYLLNYEVVKADTAMCDFECIQARVFAEQKDMNWLETSAKTDVNVNTAFETMVKEILNENKNKTFKNNKNKLDISGLPNKNNTSTCICNLL